MLHPLNVLFQLQDLIQNEHKFKLSVNKLVASNDTTFVVTVDHPNSPKDAKPWDSGIMEVFASFIQKHANMNVGNVFSIILNIIMNFKRSYKLWI